KAKCSSVLIDKKFFMGDGHMYEKAMRLINEEQDYLGALEEIIRLEKEGAKDDAFFVLKASIFEALGYRKEEIQAIATGMKVNHKNYELFYMLGLYFLDSNFNKAYLCFENALWYLDMKIKEVAEQEEKEREPELIKREASDEDNECKKKLSDLEADREQISGMLDALRTRSDVDVRNISFVILSYNNNGYMQECLEAIRDYCDPSIYEIVVVDNGSTDGVVDYLRMQDDIALIENDKNVGYPVGNNMGLRSCNPQNDVFFLNNDAVLTPNALFWMRMGLYEDRNVGAVGAISNNAMVQNVYDFLNDNRENKAIQMPVSERGGTYEEWLDYAICRNIINTNPYENRCVLNGFALLIRRETIHKVLIDGKLFDESFSPAFFETDDLGIRITKAGYRQMMVHNAFVYHYGGIGYEGDEDAIEKSRITFADKWGFDPWEYEAPADEILDWIADARTAPLRVLEVGCGMGVTLSKLKYRYPNSYVCGVEFRSDIAGLGRYMVDDMKCEQLMNFYEAYPKHSFDYIIISDVMRGAPDDVKLSLEEGIAELLKEGGRFL
ncbi:MAG: glycosyltransferase, partial [Butyrivibrio sp.]|nr:glycosyltransferase [Butyrivibrio sp.]